jgi:hypothetical protein
MGSLHSLGPAFRVQMALHGGVIPSAGRAAAGAGTASAVLAMMSDRMNGKAACMYFVVMRISNIDPILS